MIALSPARRRLFFLAALVALLGLLLALSAARGTAQTARIRWADVTIESPRGGRLSVGGVIQPLTGEPAIVVEEKYPNPSNPEFVKVARIDATTGQIIGVWTCRTIEVIRSDLPKSLWQSSTPPVVPTERCDPIALAAAGPIDIDALAAAISSPELVSVVKSARLEPRYTATAPWPWNGPPPSERISFGKISIAKPDPESGFRVEVGVPKTLPDGDLGGSPPPDMFVTNGVSSISLDVETGQVFIEHIISVDRPFFDNIIATLQVQP